MKVYIYIYMYVCIQRVKFDILSCQHKEYVETLKFEQFQINIFKPNILR